MSRREGGWSVQGCALFFSVCDESATRSRYIHPVCLGPYERGLCDYSMCVCRGVEWGVVIRWVWSSATALRYVLGMLRARSPLRDPVCGVWGVQPTIIYFSGHRGAWIIIVNGP